MQILRAAKALTMAPDSPVIEDAAVVHDQGKILAVAPFSQLAADIPAEVVDLGEHTIAPGLINAHCHLELSYLWEQTELGKGFLPWVQSLVSQRRDTYEEKAVEIAAQEMAATHTAFVGDIASHFSKDVARTLDKAGLFYIIFAEAFGFAAPKEGRSFIPKAADLQSGCLSAAGHALYSTHPDSFKMGKRQANALGLPFSMHLAEHEHELQILADGTGDFAEMLRGAGVLKGFTPPAMRPVPYAKELGLLDSGTLAVHCVQVNDEEVQTLADTKTNVCLCPRSNEFIGVGRAPWEKFHEAGVNLCLGTDSLASNANLNMWFEAAYLKKQFKGELSMLECVAMLTSNAAQAMGMAPVLGTLEAGKVARFSIVPQGFIELFD
ncbi:MAG: amidohydrolase family protein [Desulfovibrio sp.]